MKRTISVLFGLFLGVLVAQSASARERLVLEFYDAHLQGQSTLMLKREIQRQYPHIRPADLELHQVRLVAKTQHGRGTASLRVGRWHSPDQRVYGHPSDFWRRAPRTFDRVDFYNDAYDSRGPWQIDLRGNFIVRKVVLMVDETWRRPVPPRRPPVPPRRPEPPRNDTIVMECSSWDHQHASCEAPGVIASARLINEVSSGNHCRFGSGWGYAGRTLWVNHGCRGVFEVEVSGRRGRDRFVIR